MEAAVTRFTNCQVLRNGRVERGEVWVRDGRIIDPQAFFYSEKRVADKVIDCRGLVVSPGFIDTQINGECAWIANSTASLSLPIMWMHSSG